MGSLVDILALSLLWVFTSLPLVTLGPATAAPLGDRLLRGPAGPPAGPLLSAEPEANGVLRGCDPASAAGKGGPGAIAAAININASTSKFRE